MEFNINDYIDASGNCTIGTSWKHVDLSGVIFTIPDRVITLNLKHTNNLRTLPALPPNLVELTVNGRVGMRAEDRYGLTELPELPASLTYLDITYNSLTTLPPLPANLKILRCSINKLVELPELPQGLLNLGCDRNKLTQLPKLPSTLQNLSCSNNQLTSLPALPSTLQRLDCSRNKITSIPEVPPTIEQLTCDFNELTTLPIPPPTLYHRLSITFDNNPLKEPYRSLYIRYQNPEYYFGTPFTIATYHQFRNSIIKEKQKNALRGLLSYKQTIGATRKRNTNNSARTNTNSFNITKQLLPNSVNTRIASFLTGVKERPVIQNQINQLKENIKRGSAAQGGKRKTRKAKKSRRNRK